MQTPTIIRLLKRSTSLQGESLRRFGDSCGRITTTLALIPLIATIAQYTVGNTESPATMLSASVLFVLLTALNREPLTLKWSTRVRLSLILAIFVGASVVIFLRHQTSVAGSLFLLPLVPVLVLLHGLAIATTLTTAGIAALLVAELILKVSPPATAVTLAVIAVFTSWMTAAFTAVILEMLDDQLIQTERALENFKALSTTDSLTGIANRRGFDVKLLSDINSSQRTGSPLSIAMIDIDKFKAFNDAYGHPEGDKALHLLSKTLSGQLHRKTDLVARYGGEEFAVIMPHTNLQDAARVACRLREAVENKCIKPSEALPPTLTISVGVASASDNTMTPEKIIKSADSALYESKRTGRNRVTMIDERNRMTHVPVPQRADCSSNGTQH